MSIEEDGIQPAYLFETHDLKWIVDFLAWCVIPGLQVRSVLPPTNNNITLTVMSQYTNVNIYTTYVKFEIINITLRIRFVVYFVG